MGTGVGSSKHRPPRRNHSGHGTPAPSPGHRVVIVQSSSPSGSGVGMGVGAAREVDETVTSGVGLGPVGAAEGASSPPKVPSGVGAPVTICVVVVDVSEATGAPTGARGSAGSPAKVGE